MKSLRIELNDLVDKNLSSDKRITIKPVLKWAGGKTQLLPELVEKMPDNYNNYIEPFFGGGALFFHTQPSTAILADINPELANLYEMVKSKPAAIIELLETYENTEDFFYNLRSEDRESLSKEKQAARTLYLNKTCFNGLYRVNKKGHFNTPYGRYENPNIVNEKGILAVIWLHYSGQKSYKSLK